MSTLRIRIGAVKDRSIDVVFASIEKRGELAAKRIGQMMQGAMHGQLNKGGKGAAAGGSAATKNPLAIQARQEAKIIRDMQRQREKSIDRSLAFEHKANRERLKMVEREAAAKEKAIQREITARVRAAQKAQNLAIRTEQRAQRMAQKAEYRERINFAQRTSHRATRFLMPNAPIGSIAARAGGDIMRGLGVDTSVAGMISRSVAMEQQATQISNSGYLANAKDANSKRVDPKELVADARGISQATGIDSGQALDALGAFAGIAGDLDLGRRSLKELAILSAATGTDLGHMAAASANVANQLGDVPDKAERIQKVMRVIAGQGKLGAVEISDLATQMARVAAAANSFEGDASENITKMGALAQLARSTGGAPSAAEAARSVGGFSNTLKKSARINAFADVGVNVFADEGKTKFKDPIRLIEESLVATNGNKQELNKLFMDVVGARAVAGLATKFTDAGGGDAGIEEVRKEISRLTTEAEMSQQEIDESAARAAKTMAAQAARIQANLEKVTDLILDDLAPAIEKAAPHMIAFAQAMGQLATWALQNPGEAIVRAIELSILRAGIESVFRKYLERALMNNVGSFGAPGSPGVGGPGGAVVGGAGGGKGKMAKAAGVLAAAATIYFAYEAGRALGDAIAPYVFKALFEGQAKALNEATGKDAEDYSNLKKLEKKAETEGLSEEDRATLTKERIDLAGRIGQAKFRAQKSPEMQAAIDLTALALPEWAGGKTEEQLARDTADTTNLAALEVQLAAIERVMNSELRVRVVNPTPAAGSGSTSSTNSGQATPNQFVSPW